MGLQEQVWDLVCLNVILQPRPFSHHDPCLCLPFILLIPSQSNEQIKSHVHFYQKAPSTHLDFFYVEIINTHHAPDPLQNTRHKKKVDLNYIGIDNQSKRTKIKYTILKKFYGVQRIISDTSRREKSSVKIFLSLLVGQIFHFLSHICVCLFL